jgi:hypothetical protein
MSEKNRRLFVEVNVWREIDESKLVVYRCLQVLPQNGYVVKAADYYHGPLTLDQVRERDFYFVDSMFDGGLELAASETYPTLEEAIARFDEEFED